MHFFAHLCLSCLWHFKNLHFLPTENSLTVAIRIRLKNSVFGIFCFVILERQQPSFVFRTKISSKTQVFQVEEF